VIEFDPACTLCPRLAAYLAAGRERFPHYHCAPVGPFGAARPQLLIVGLAPGFHGANASGRPFTGDHAGILLYRTLHELGLATAAESRAADDGLRLIDCRITNAVKCAPPGNKPLPVEVATCNRYLTAELAHLPAGRVIVALGAIAHDAVLSAVGVPRSSRRFAHGAEHSLPRGLRLLDSYHCSRYNTQTRRLTAEMFRAVVGRAAALARAAH
jgi:uracil-DNA glycosylase family 4